MKSADNPKKHLLLIQKFLNSTMKTKMLKRESLQSRTLTISKNKPRTPSIYKWSTLSSHFLTPLWYSESTKSNSQGKDKEQTVRIKLQLYSKTQVQAPHNLIPLELIPLLNSVLLKIHNPLELTVLSKTHQLHLVKTKTCFKLQEWLLRD